MATDSNADLNLGGTPSLVARDGHKLVLGTAGLYDTIFLRNGVQVAAITSTGFTINDITLPNNTYLQARNAANSADLDVLKVDATDDVVLNATTGNTIKLSVNETAEVTVSDDLLAFSGTTPIIQSGGSLVLKIAADAQRLFTFDASSDTAFAITFGDGVTAAQVLTISASSADDSDNGAIHIGRNSSTRNAFISAYGNEHATNGASLILSTGNSAAIDGRLIINSVAAAPIQFYTTNLLRFSIAAGGDLTQDATNGGNITLSKASTSVAQTVVTGVTAAGTTVADATALTGVYNVVATAAAGTGVKLWSATIGSTIWVQNLGANDLEVYPIDGSGTINAAAGGAGITLAAATDTIGVFTRTTATAWIGYVVAAPAT